MSTRSNRGGRRNERQSKALNLQRGGNLSNNESTARKMVGNYILGKTIGEGTFGKVKIAVHIPTGEKVAVKVLEKNRIKEQADVRRVNREIKILKKTRHVNVIQLYEVLDTQNSVYLIMENADGGEMFDYIVAHRHVAEEQACTFFHQIVDGVEVLHRHEITHRDLKPENLLLKHTTNGWLIKIVDFGLSNTHEGGKLLSTACGSPCYAAPEMIAGKRYNGPMADIWSMGVILFALVCGYLPFEDPNTSALFKKIMSGQYKTAKWISGEVRDMIKKILVVDPMKRFTISHIRQHPWYALVKEEDVPKDIVHSSTEVEAAKIDALKGVVDAGLEHQAVMDCLASKACNSLTATYYLLEERAKKRIMKMKATNPITREVLAVYGPSDATNVNFNATSNGGASHEETLRSQQEENQLLLPLNGDPKPVSSNSSVSGQNAVPKLDLQQIDTNGSLSHGVDNDETGTSCKAKGNSVSQTARVQTLQQTGPEINKMILSHTARPTAAGKDAMQKSSDLFTLPIQSLQEQQATVDVPLDAFIENFCAISTEEHGTATGPPRELWVDLPKNGESIRPGTRRSRMRSRAGEVISDEDNMSAPAGFLDSDQLSNIPITVTSETPGIALTVAFPKHPTTQREQRTHGTMNQNKLRRGQLYNAAPQAPKPSSVGGVHGGRRGKHLLNAVGNSGGVQ